MRIGLFRSAFPILAAAITGGAAPASPARVIASIDLMKPFATRSHWRFIATQGPDVQDPVEGPGDMEAGAIRLCISRDGGKSCGPDLERVMGATEPLFAVPHFLNSAGIVRPHGRALLLIETSSVHSGDGDQIEATQILAYDRGGDRFVPAYGKMVGHNRNEEVRYMASGPLNGAMISAEPTGNAPYCYWIVVSRLGPAGTYRQVLRYRSATRYDDGNSLAVIDSEMPNIERRLGLWRPGTPLPLPKGRCPKPRLAGMELWCEPRRRDAS
ncbi:MAG TPA: hypothetical protein VFW19_09270 [Allosphingosinicella sp.]|nr:hypothetical protein [Allosphingosinicella sp.]